MGIHVAPVRRTESDALEGKSDNAQGCRTDILARAEEEGAVGRVGSPGGSQARGPARGRSSTEHALALQGLVPGAPGGSSTASGDDIVDGEAAGDEQRSTRPEGGRPRRGGRADRSHPHRMDQSGRDDFDAFGSADARGAGADRGLGGTPILGGFDHHFRE
jgi:hypothetical protein